MVRHPPNGELTGLTGLTGWEGEIDRIEIRVRDTALLVRAHFNLPLQLFDGSYIVHSSAPERAQAYASDPIPSPSGRGLG